MLFAGVKKPENYWRSWKQSILTFFIVKKWLRTFDCSVNPVTVVSVFVLHIWTYFSSLFCNVPSSLLINLLIGFTMNHFIVWSIKSQKMFEKCQHFLKYKIMLSNVLFCFVYSPKIFSLLSERSNETRKLLKELKSEHFDFFLVLK